jgi:hypothetical protein
MTCGPSDCTPDGYLSSVSATHLETGPMMSCRKSALYQAFSQIIQSCAAFGSVDALCFSKEEVDPWRVEITTSVSCGS